MATMMERGLLARFVLGNVFLVGKFIGKFISILKLAKSIVNTTTLTFFSKLFDIPFQTRTKA